MRAALALILAAALTGCALPTAIVQRPPEGLEAVRMLETVRLTGALGNTWELPANSLWVQDRVRSIDNVRLWCGTMVIRDLATENRQMCFTLNGRTIGVLADVLQSGYQRELPEGGFEMTRLR